MHLTTPRDLRRAVALVLATAVAAPAAWGQAAPQLEEIIVTAQKREETLRDVPISVNAVGGERIEEAGIVRLDDLKAYVPNLQVTETGIANNFYVRGIGSGLNQGFEQSVSIYADGIYLWSLNRLFLLRRSLWTGGCPARLMWGLCQL